MSKKVVFSTAWNKPRFLSNYLGGNMVRKLLAITVFLAVCNICYADWNTFETKQDAYDRRSNENYNTYRDNNYQQPLGGYNRSINDNGGRNYGSSNVNYGMNSLNSNNSKNNNSWNGY